MEQPQAASNPTYDVIGRYLAGPNDRGVEHIRTTLDAAGWTSWPDSDGNIHFFDPTQRLAVEFIPEGDRWLGFHHTQWRLWARPDKSGALLWDAEFTDHTPYEILAPLVTTLADAPDAALTPTTHHSLLEGGAEALQPLLDASWRADPTRMLAYQSEAANASLAYELDGAAWLVKIRPHQAAPVLWGARLSTALPLPLLRSLCEGLGSAVPSSQRTVHTFPGAHVTPTPAPDTEGRHHGGR
ncbi:DUF317 domain-containing protein [Streptomyces sp. NPDC127098]|uniref:DUF317 domain-containing protein n=1 Tax=Streptomyces sp. NPDC127098 TaxID=3347137 RepID=UPI003661F2A2